MFFNPKTWQGSFRPPEFKDPRWLASGLLSLYCVMGFTILGFTRQPLQVVIACVSAMVFDIILEGLLKGTYRFPLSSYMSCISLALLLNFSLGYHFLWLPVAICISSKYLLTFHGKHFFNPSMFAICICLYYGKGWVSLSPAYQWVGKTESTLLMSVFIITGALLLFISKINRHWLILSFLFFYTLQTALRGYILRHHLPWETLVLGTLTSPSFYLFTFYMITDPKTSPPTKKGQIWTGFFIAALDLYYHTQFSLFTFFYAGVSVAGGKFLFLHLKDFIQKPQNILVRISRWLPAVPTSGIILGPAFLLYLTGAGLFYDHDTHGLKFQRIPISQSGIGYVKSDIHQQTDPRVQHVAKWILGVGEAVAVADVNLDGRQDLFFTQTLKSLDWRAKLYINEGGFKFTKVSIPALDSALPDHNQNGLPSSALFLDYDNDGDADLFVGFSFGRGRLYQNQMIPTGTCEFREVTDSLLLQDYAITINTNAFDFNRDGRLDLLQNRIIPDYLMDYKDPVYFSLFHLPAPEYEGDRRMLHFMHESWSDANNGGKNSLWINTDTGFIALNSDSIGLSQTRWSLASGTADFNQDGWTDLYIANDFGRDDAYLNVGGKFFERQQGIFYQDLGLDTYKGMNTSIGDLDGDLQEDIHISNVHHALQAEGSLVWLNKTKPGASKVDFKESATQLGLLNPERFGWGADIGDLDKDGWLDLIQANGMVSDAWDKTQEECIDYWYLNEKLARTGPEIHTYADSWADIRGACIYPNEADRVMLNHNGRYFTDISDQVGVDHMSNSRGTVMVDLDNDGDLDLIFTDLFAEPKIYNNLQDSSKKWLGIELQGNGKTCNSDAVGTRVLVHPFPTSHRAQVREKRLMTGLSGQGDQRLFFGFGSKEIDSLQIEINWCGTCQKKKTIFEFNRYILLKQDSF